jgi:hypothetical protein
MLQILFLKITLGSKSEPIIASKVYNRDQDLGIINPSTTTIRFKDGAYLDGDKIELSFNDKV